MALAHLTINLDAFTGDDRPPVSQYSTITLDPGADHIDAANDVIHVRTIVVSLDRQGKAATANGVPCIDGKVPVVAGVAYAVSAPNVLRGGPHYIPALTAGQVVDLSDYITPGAPLTPDQAAILTARIVALETTPPDHGALTGLNEDDHPQYALADGTRGAFAAPLGADDNYVTDAEKVKLANLSGTNTGDQTLPTWSTISGKPAVVAAGATEADARTAIGAGTSSLVVGTGAGDAKAGNYQPTAANISDSTTTGRAVLTAADAAAARTALSLGTAAAADVGDFATAAQGALAESASQPGHAHAGADITSGTVAAARLPAASDTASGIVELATTAETTTGTDTTRAVTAAGVKAVADTKANTSHSHAGADITSGTVAYARLPVGTAASTLAAGDDSRIAGAAQKSANLSDLANASTARTNLGLGDSAVVGALPIPDPGSFYPTDTITAALQLIGSRERYGTGSPEGVVTAPVGTYYTDTAITNGAMRWAKKTGTGNTGWRVTEGDTGRRNITATLPGWGGNLYLQRVNEKVYVTGTISKADSNLPGSVPNVFPSGFTPRLESRWIGYGFNHSVGDVVTQIIITSTLMAVSRVSGASWTSPQMTSVYFPTLIFTTIDAWPTTLPGTAA